MWSWARLLRSGCRSRALARTFEWAMLRLRTRSVLERRVWVLESKFGFELLSLMSLMIGLWAMLLLLTSSEWRGGFSFVKGREWRDGWRVLSSIGSRGRREGFDPTSACARKEWRLIL